MSEGVLYQLGQLVGLISAKCVQIPIEAVTQHLGDLLYSNAKLAGIRFVVDTLCGGHYHTVPRTILISSDCESQCYALGFVTAP